MMGISIFAGQSRLIYHKLSSCGRNWADARTDQGRHLCLGGGGRYNSCLNKTYMYIYSKLCYMANWNEQILLNMFVSYS